MNDLSPEEFEQLRRKDLETLQALYAKTPSRIWTKVFRERSEAYDEGLSAEFMWVPIQPYESLLEMAARIERGYGQAAQHTICEECAGGSAPVWAGFDLNGRQIWMHQIQVPDKVFWLDRLLRRHFGYYRHDRKHSETVVCPASKIIQEFTLLGVPATMPGVNTGAYPPDPKPYGDPMAHRMGDE
jgi:hypothetical protein